MTKLKYISLTIVCLALTATIAIAQNDKSSTLAGLYSAYAKNHSVQTQQKFFNEFPTTFKHFQRVYGYDDDKGASPNYEVSLEHVELFFRTSKVIDANKFADKLIGLTCNGKWEADAKNYLQDHFLQYFFSHQLLMLEKLSKSSRRDREGVFHFMLDGPHFDDNVNNKLKAAVNKYPELKISLKKVTYLVKKSNGNDS